MFPLPEVQLMENFCDSENQENAVLPGKMQFCDYILCCLLQYLIHQENCRSRIAIPVL